MTEKQIAEKYSNIEDKIPSVWKTFEDAGTELAGDVALTWNVREGELIRVMALIDMRMAGAGKPSFNLSNHIDPRFAFAGLYPERMKEIKIHPVSDTKKIALAFAIWIGNAGYTKHQSNDRWYDSENYVGTTEELFEMFIFNRDENKN